MSSASAEPVRVPPRLRDGEVLIANPALGDAEPAVVKAESLTTWTKRGWVRVDPDAPEPPTASSAPPVTDKKSQDAAKPSSTKKED